MAKLQDLWKKAKEYIDTSVNDNQGWIQQRKFTPLKAVTNNWSSSNPVSQGLIKAQQFTQPAVSNVQAWANPQVRQNFNQAVIQPKVQQIVGPQAKGVLPTIPPLVSQKTLKSPLLDKFANISAQGTRAVVNAVPNFINSYVNTNLYNTETKKVFPSSRIRKENQLNPEQMAFWKSAFSNDKAKNRKIMASAEWKQIDDYMMAPAKEAVIMMSLTGGGKAPKPNEKLIQENFNRMFGKGGSTVAVRNGSNVAPPVAPIKIGPNIPPISKVSTPEVGGVKTMKVYGDNSLPTAKQKLEEMGNNITSVNKVKDSRGEVVYNVKYEPLKTEVIPEGKGITEFKKVGEYKNPSGKLLRETYEVKLPDGSSNIIEKTNTGYHTFTNNNRIDSNQNVTLGSFRTLEEAKNSFPSIPSVKTNEITSSIQPKSELKTTDTIQPQVSPITDTNLKTESQPVSSQLNSSNGSVPPINTEEYLKQLKQDQQKASSVPQTRVMFKIKSVIGDIKRKLVDSTAPIEDTLFGAEKKGGYKVVPSDNISYQIDRSIRSRELAAQFTKDNGLVDVIKGVPDVNALDQYLIAKHSVEVETQTGRNAVKDAELVKQLSSVYEPYAQKVIQYGQKLLDYSVQSGLVSPETAAMLKQKYPNYVPLNRIFNELEKSNPTQTVGGGVASLSKQTVVQKLKGSDRAIVNPTESLLTKTLDAFTQGEKNIGGRMLASYKDLPGNPFQITELPKGQSGVNTFSFLDNGVKRTFETTPEIASAAKFLDKRQLGFVGNLFALPVRLARIGITGINLPFVASNLAKDQVSAFINSDHALQTSMANPKVFLKSLWTAVGHGAEFDNWIRNAGGGTSFDISRSSPNVTVDQLRAGRNIGTKIAYTVTHPGELMRTVENIINRGEETTRLQQFIGTRDALIKEGRTPADANILAADASRKNTTNFSRSGDWGKALNSVFLYMNAGIQGSRTLLRNLANRPLQTAAKIGISVFLPLATITAWNLSDPKRKEAYDDIQDFEKDNNLILIPPNPTKDPKTGKWNVIKIPLSQEVANLTVPVRKGVESIYGYDAPTAMDVTKSLIGTATSLNVQSPRQLIGQFIPQAVKPGLEAVLNKNTFTGTDIVPQYLDGKLSSSLLPEQQVRPDTSGTARAIGGVLNTSPIKVEQFVKSSTGGVGSQLINASDNVLATLGLIPQEQVGGQSIRAGFSSRFAEATGGKKLGDLYDSIDKANQTGTKLDLNQAVQNKDKIYFPTLVTHKDGTTSYALKSEPNLNIPEPYVGTGKRTFETSPEAPKTTMERIDLAAKAVTTNPANIKSVIMAIFTQERMRKMTGDTLIFERETNLNKTPDTTDAVDHIIPLSLGGDNSDANKRYISASANQAKAQLETKLFRQLSNNEITGAEARKQIAAYVDKYETPSVTPSSNKDISLTFPEVPKLTGLTEVDKANKADYSTALSKVKSNAKKLNQNGQLSNEEYNNILIQISNAKSKSGTGTGSKKLKKAPAIAKVSVPKISYKIAKSPKKKLAGVKIAKMPNLKALASTKISKLKYDVGKVKNIKIAKVKGLTVGKKLA